MTRPTFRKPTVSSATESPEALFYSLSRKKSHAYLRGPQQDALRDYFEKHQKATDFALELPTGAGKTTVGLLVADWHRRNEKERTAFVTLTNQLAAQVLAEAKALGIEVADLRGKREDRLQQEEMRFKDGSAVAVSTYSNLFNVSPVIARSGTLILDDAHGGGSYVASMWTTRITAERHTGHYEELRAALTPLLTPTQEAELDESSAARAVAFIDMGGHATVVDQVVAILDALPDRHDAGFAWGKIRSHLHACHLLVSRESIVIRPYIPPTWDHAPFSAAKRRCFLSATLGDLDDLRRAYGIQRLEHIRAKHSQDGRRYIFAPGLGLDDHQTKVALSEIWKRLAPRRAVLLAPSFPTVGSAVALLSATFAAPKVLQARDIEENLEPFTAKENVLLALANRYDGLDLPDDDCRLLVMSESPRAVNELEACLSSVWRLGPAMRSREANRLAQGMGRCTRSATDYSVILLIGESLVNAVTTRDLLRRLPTTLRNEISWGGAQQESYVQNAHAFAELVSGLVEDEKYRKEANTSIDEVSILDDESDHQGAEPVAMGSKEVAYSKALWNGDYSHSLEVARDISDRLSGDEWSGFRAWWLYLASVAARLAGNDKAELDALRRAKSTSINGGWLDFQLRGKEVRDLGLPIDRETEGSECVSLAWTTLEALGWAGRKYHDWCEEMTSDLAATNNHKLFHRGLVSLGKLLGANAWSPEGQGAPDVIWGFGDLLWFSFEAKAKKLQDGLGFSKNDLLEAKGHIDWLRKDKSLPPAAVIHAVVIAPVHKTQETAEPHKGALYFVSTAQVLQWAKESARSGQKLRTKFSGHDFAAARAQFALELEKLGMGIDATRAFLLATPLQQP